MFAKPGGVYLARDHAPQCGPGGRVDEGHVEVAEYENEAEVRGRDVRGLERRVDRLTAGDEQPDARNEQGRQEHGYEHEVELLACVESPGGCLWRVPKDGSRYAGQPFAIQSIEPAQLASGLRKRSPVATHHDKYDTHQQHSRGRE